MKQSPAVALRQVCKVFQQGKLEIHALDGISLLIPPGQFVAVMGASGSGKSTLLHVIAGLTRLTAGEIALLGQRLTEMTDNQITQFRRRSIGLIFQAYNLLPTMSALDNVCLPLIIEGKNRRGDYQKAADLLAQIGLADRQHHRPDELSGGQQQRVAIARALIHEAPLLLADEPTGNLDSHTGEEILHLLRSLVPQRTIVMVTHDARAAAYADRIITLSDGRILEELHA